ncbi:hypothetical protein FJTKL_14213 [Diaporthe vaccinii]|uniref:Uncharacterized protein n=1 Tax=Diaporthe vaccinii TaxID=105482 RepID=A0ABR4E8N1_9PEZI
MKSLSSNVLLDALTEEVVESVFAGFNFQHISIAQLSKEKSSWPADRSANRRMDAMKAMEDLDPSRLATGEVKLKFGDASVFLVIDPGSSWAFFTESGAIRRIIMNLFGNALKHTQQGTIRVTLKQSDSKRSNERLVQITVADTGHGISQEYLRNDLFKPFSQEDSLAPGSGLGLSIVKKITSNLRGRITVTSLVNVGTTVTVALPLALPSPDTKLVEPDDEVEFNKQRVQLRGLRIRLIGFDQNRTADSEESDTVTSDVELNGHRLVRQICRDWLHMEVISGRQAEHLAPDLVLMSEDSLPPEGAPDALTKPPCIVVCANALVAYQQSTAPESASRSGVLEFISQPVGPRKLAKILLLASDRWIAKQVILPVADEAISPLSADTPGFGVLGGTPKLATPAISVLPMRDKPPQTPPRSRPSTDLELSPLEPVVMPPAVVDEPTYPSPKPQAPAPPGNEYLLVDDNPINLKILSAYMHKLGLPYQTATNGQEAVDAFVREPSRFRCVFMDISMPVMDGFQATRLIRAYESGHMDVGAATARAPTSIFALSGLASASAQQEALWSGVDLFLTKPVKLKELGSILRSRGLLEAA